VGRARGRGAHPAERPRPRRHRHRQRDHGIDFPLVHASAEAPPLPEGSFDLVFSEYGAAIWCDPYDWVAQAYRLLRPGGRLTSCATR
jgi:ubiquinone/menaquinone biosynthesis C-methylase UbiE